MVCDGNRSFLFSVTVFIFLMLCEVKLRDGKSESKNRRGEGE